MRLGLLLLVASSMFGAITGPLATTVKQGNTTAGDFTITTPAIDTTGASLLVIVVSTSTGVNPCSLTITDSKGNTWTCATPQVIASFASCAIWYSWNALTVGSGHTFSAFFATGTAKSMGVTAWAGTLTTSSPFGQENGANTGGGTATSIGTGNITPAQNGELVISGLGARQGTTYTSTLTIDQNVNWVSATLTGLVAAHQIQTTATTVADTFGMTGAGQMSAVIASFKSSTTTVLPIRHRVTQ